MKAILVIEMPSSCLDCPCYFSNDGYCICQEAGKLLANEDVDNERPTWCPLKKVPKKKELMTKPKLPTHEFDVRLGYNACIDELLGGAE